MRQISKKKLLEVSKSRPQGYYDEVMSHVEHEDEKYVYVSMKAFNALKEKYSPRSGPGFELKKLLKLFGIIPEPGCQCNKRAAYMDQMGCQWCRDNIDTILGWLQEEANKRGLLFVKSVARIVVYRAIVNAEAVANKE